MLQMPDPKATENQYRGTKKERYQTTFINPIQCGYNS